MSESTGPVRALRALKRRGVITTAESDRHECCGLSRDADGFCSHRGDHPIFVDSEPASTTPDPAAILRAAAAGRREYAVNTPPATAEALELQAATLDQAAEIVGGDYGALYGWLPSWRWTRGMTDRLHDGGVALAWADVAALAGSNTPAEENDHV